MSPDFSLPLLTFWVGVGGVLYHHTGCPAGIWLLSCVFGWPQSLPDEPSSLPFATVVVAALNEEEDIRQRIVNALAADNLPVRVLRRARLFASVSAALVMGLWRWLVGQRETTWRSASRMPRPGETASDAATVRRAVHEIAARNVSA